MRTRTLLLPVTALLAFLLVATTARAAVELLSFDGTWQDDIVVLTWETGNERDHGGFELWRSTEPLPIEDGQLDLFDPTLEQVNQDTITNPAGPCQPGGRQYQFDDTTVDPQEPTYYYYLESYSCSTGQSSFYGSSETEGLRVSQDGVPTPTRTPTEQASATPQPSATPPPSATPLPPSATPTLAPGVTPPTATATRPASATAVASATANVPASPTRQSSATVAPSATRDPNLPPATQPAQPPTQPAQAATATLPSGGAQATPGAATATAAPIITGDTGGSPSPTPTQALALNTAATATVAGSAGDMSAQPQAATPTVLSILSQQPTTPTDPLVASQTAQSDGLDRLLQGLIGLILLAVVALIGFLGWSYVRRAA